MLNLVLVRHGKSLWNQENRFTGWMDIDLSDAGIQEAHDAGKLLKKEGHEFDSRLRTICRYYLNEKG